MVYTCRDDLTENVSKTTATECKKSTFCWRASLKTPLLKFPLLFLIRTLIFALIGAVHVSRRWLGHFANNDSSRAMKLNIGEETITCKWKCIISNVTNNNNELWKTVGLTSYKLQKLTTFAVRFNHFKVCPSLPSFVIRVLLVPSFNVWSRYFYVSLNLVDFQKLIGRGTKVDLSRLRRLVGRFAA